MSPTIADCLKQQALFVRPTLTCHQGAHTQRREDTGYPATGQSGRRSDRPAQVTPRSRNGPRCLSPQLFGKAHRSACNRRDLAERKESPEVFTQGSQLNRRRKWGWQPRSSTPTKRRCPTSSSSPGNADDATQVCGEAGTTCCVAIAVATRVFRTRRIRTVPEMLILSPAIDLLAPSIEHSNAIGAALFPGVQHRLSSGLHPLRSNGVVL
jgi:hypothetical protein